MTETLVKLRPDRDLQCYFEKPSAIAAMSEATESGFTVSGTWRQQFDWAVIEWNRDNVYEHPLFRNLPDGDLSGLTLTYEETRENCIPLPSTLYPTVDWPYLRVWAEQNGVEEFYRVRLADYAEPVEGQFEPASAEFELSGQLSPGEYAGIAWPGEHHTYQILAGDTLESVVGIIAESVNAFSTIVRAERDGARIRLYYATPGAGQNGNRFGAYSYYSGMAGAGWNESSKKFSNGVSPTKWRIRLPFANLLDIEGRVVPTGAVRKLRWTYSADLQDGPFVRSEFSVRISEWQVSGVNRAYRVAGPGSMRIENEDRRVSYAGGWQRTKGNFSGGSIEFSEAPGSSVTCEYNAACAHELYVGTRITGAGGRASVSVDGATPRMVDLARQGEDVLVRLPLGSFSAGAHTVELTHAGLPGSPVYFDYVECAIPSEVVSDLAPNPTLALSTDWDTDHSLAIAPERTAWMIHRLGFHGRVNHYAGAMWFYELLRKNHRYASATVRFEGAPKANDVVSITIGAASTLTHLIHPGDTADTIAKAFEIEINGGYTGIRAEAAGSTLTISARAMGEAGNGIGLAVSPKEGDFRMVSSGATLEGGSDGQWITDLNASPRLNRAARDWTVSFYRALAGYGLEGVGAFSMELQHGDPAVQAGIAQRYPNGSPVMLTTPALQTNFSPASTEFWKGVYADMAELMRIAGRQPYLQFGEVQWWYFPSDGSGMPFYDDYTKQRFRSEYGRDLRFIANEHADPAQFPEEVEFLPKLIGDFTDAVTDHVRETHADCLFEVLYPTDVNETLLNLAINYPLNAWTPERLTCLKTESFSYTLGRDFNRSRKSVSWGRHVGFGGANKSHLIGVSDPKTAWLREARLGESHGLESVVLFALDQFCLVGYRWPRKRVTRRSAHFG